MLIMQLYNVKRMCIKTYRYFGKDYRVARILDCKEPFQEYHAEFEIDRTILTNSNFRKASLLKRFSCDTVYLDIGSKLWFLVFSQ